MDIQSLLEFRFTEPGKGVPSRRQLWSEAGGFFLCGLGIFLGLTLFGYDPSDMGKLAFDEKLNNIGGPVGAHVSHFFIKTIGKVSYFIPVALMIWGPLMALGYVKRPKPRLFVASVLIALFAAAMIEVFFPDLKHAFGHGGVWGRWLGAGLVDVIGKGGAFLFLVFSILASLIFTRNITFTRDKNSREKRHVDMVEEARRAAENLETHSQKPSGGGGRGRKKTDEVEDVDMDVIAELDQESFFLDLGPNKKAPAKIDSSMFKSKPVVISKAGDESEITRLLVEKLEEFKVKGEITNVTQGPVVKTYEFEPSAGTKVSQIEALQSDLQRLLKAKSLRVVPIPGASTVGFEIPNDDRKVIHFGNLVNSPDFKSKKIALPVAMGVDCFGNPVIEDLAEMPHLLVAGSTGSGKSVFINTLITSLLVRHSAKDMRLILIDPKMVELGAFNDTAHMSCPVITDIVANGLPVLQRLVDEMEERYKMLKAVGAKNLPAFNQIIKTKKKGSFKSFKGKWEPLPYVVVVVDEFADMMMNLGKDAEQLIARLAQKARAAGIHMVIATQRPSVKVVTGLIKANFPTRVGFRVTSAVDSRTILDQSGAETLLGKGDMLYLSPMGVSRLHAGFLDEDEIEKVVKACKGKGRLKSAA